MKNNLLKFYMLAFFLVSDFVLFAQPGAENPQDDLEGEEGSIDSKLIYLALIGIAFAAYYFNKKKQAQLEN